MVTHCGFNLYPSLVMLRMFSYVSGPSLYVLLGEVSVQVLCPFFNWVFCLPGVELYEFSIFWRSGPCLRYHWQICFPIYSWFSFIFMLFSLAMQKLFNLMRSHLFILSFMSLALGDISVKILLHEMSEIFLPIFSSRTFMVLTTYT